VGIRHFVVLSIATSVSAVPTPPFAGADFTPPAALAHATEPPVVTGTVDLVIGLVTVRLDPTTPVARIAELVAALRTLP